MARTDSKTALRIAKRQVSLGIGADGLIGAIRVTDGAVMLNSDGSLSRIFLVPVPDAPREGAEVGRSRTDLVHVHQGIRTILDSGSTQDMEMLVEAIVARLECRLNGRMRRNAVGGSLAALAICAAVAAGFVVGAGPPPGPTNLGFSMPGVAPAAPGSAPSQVGSVLTPERVDQMLRAAAAERGFTRVERPVSLDAPAAATTTPRGPTQPPASLSAAPHPSAPPSAEPAVPATPPPVVPPPAPRAEAPATVPAAVAAAEPPAAPASVAAAAPAAAAVPEDPEAAQRLLASLQEMRQRLSQGGDVTPEMLASLPPAIAERLRAAQAGQPAPAQAATPTGGATGATMRLSVQTLARAGRDPYGIPDVPEANTWAGTNGRVRLPLPGGGDIRKPEEMELFGLEP